MINLNTQIEIPRGELEKEHYDVWYKMIADKNLIVINGSDDIVDTFIKRSICRFIVKHKWSIKNYKILKDFMRVPESTKTFSICQVYEYLWKTHQIPLVIEICSQNKLRKVTKILSMYQESFRLIVLNKSGACICNLRSSKRMTTASHLKKQQLMKLVNFPIKLQGRDLKGLGEFHLYESKISNLNVRDIIYILCNKVNIGEELAVLPDGFVKRSLKRVWINPSVLNEVTDDIFVIQDRLNTEIDLALCVDNSKILDRQDIDNFDSHVHKIVLYRDVEDLKKIENYFKKSKIRPIHFLILHRESYLEWVKSWGSIENLKGFRNSKELEDRIINNESITSLCKEKNLLLISSNPGMGKSVLLNYFARNIPTNYWIIKINMVEYQASYRDIKSCSSLRVFFEQTLEEEREKNLFLTKDVFTKFYKSRDIVVLLDSFTEISKEYRNDAKRFIQLLSESGYFVLITTKPALKNDLESLLDTFSIDLKLFTREDQEEFLENYFSKLYKIDYEREFAISFVRNLLDATKRDLNDHVNEFTGVPLQMSLLVEEFKDNFMKHKETGDFAISHFSLLSFYKNLITRNVEITCARAQQYKPCKALYALGQLFSKEDLNDLEIDSKLQAISSVFTNMLESIQDDGIVVAKTQTNIKFIHRIFAEYLAGEWLAENIMNENEAIAKKLYKITFESNLMLARNIFDGLLAKDRKLHLAIINFEMGEINQLIRSEHIDDVDDGNRSFLHLLASWGLQLPPDCKDCESSKIETDKMMRCLMLIPQEKLQNLQDDILRYTPIDYAIISRSLHIANVLCQKITNSGISINIENLDNNFLLNYCCEMNYLALHCIIEN